MKKIVLFIIIFLPNIPYTAKAQLNHDFQRRFGSDSAVYNESHYYFATKTKTTHDKRPKKKSFREQLRERMDKIDKKKKRRTRKPLKRDPDLSDL